MGALWRGSWTTKARIASGLVLFIYVTLHFLNIGTALISVDAANRFQAGMALVVRSVPGTILLYGALLTHAALSLGKIALTARLRLRSVDLLQVALGVLVPLLLATHVVFTRGSASQFETNDTVAYIAALIWDTDDGWQQALLLLITWAHGCIGLHMWLRLTNWWRRCLPIFTGLGALVPAFALAGFLAEGRRITAIIAADEDAALDFYDESNWPGPSEFAALVEQSSTLYWITLGFLSLTIVLYVLRQIRRPGQTVQITYVNGPTVRSIPGPTLLEISRTAGVPHMALCGGKGRCTTCRVIVEDGLAGIAPPSHAERRALHAVNAPPNARLACQMRPKGAATVYKVFRPDGSQHRGHASQGKEAELAVLFLDMRGFTARTSDQLPYDVVFLLNRFFDAIVPSIHTVGGTVDKYMGDGLLAVFETHDSASSARAALDAARGIEAALAQFNAQIASEDQPPVKIGIGLHLGGLVLGDIGARGNSARTLIGDSVNTASRLESKTKELGASVLISAPLLRAAGINADRPDMIELTLRGLSSPLSALPVRYGQSIDTVLLDMSAPEPA